MHAVARGDGTVGTEEGRRANLLTDFCDEYLSDPRGLDLSPGVLPADTTCAGEKRGGGSEQKNNQKNYRWIHRAVVALGPEIELTS